MDRSLRELRVGRASVAGEPASGDSVVRYPAGAPAFRRRLEDFESVLATMSSLRLSFRAVALVSVTGAETSRCSAVAWSECQVPGVDSMHKIEIRRDPETLLFSDSRFPDATSFVYYFDIVCPADHGVTISAAHAAIDVWGVRGRIEIRSAHGRVSLRENLGDAEVTTSEGGHVDWSGRQGNIRLISQLGIDLNLTGGTFEGKLEANTQRSIHVVMPAEFESGIEVSVAAADRFKPSPGAVSRFRRHEHSGRVLWICGTGQPALRLTSADGTVFVEEGSSPGPV